MVSRYWFALIASRLELSVPSTGYNMACVSSSGLICIFCWLMCLFERLDLALRSCMYLP
jgi:hypothetical protein